MKIWAVIVAKKDATERREYHLFFANNGKELKLKVREFFPAKYWKIESVNMKTFFDK